MLKSHESMVEIYWEFCRMIIHVVNDYTVTLDIDLRTFALIVIVSAHPCCARKFTCHIMHKRAR